MKMLVWILPEAQSEAQQEGTLPTCQCLSLFLDLTGAD